MNANPICFICNTSSNFLIKKDGFDIWQCPKCKLDFVYPQPPEEFLSKIYSYESGYQNSKPKDLSLKPTDGRFIKMFDYLKEQKPSGRLLDIGCSNGQFLYWAKNIGFQCFGLEINKRTADIAIANGFDVRIESIFATTFQENSFDILVLGDVIEHVSDPKLFIEKCKKLLKDDGLFIISTPNMDSFWTNSTLMMYKLFNIPWSSSTPPHHLFQFSFANLDSLMVQSGLTFKKVTYSKPPPLLYELVSLHLRTRFKKDKNLKTLAYMIFGYCVYTLLYIINYISKPLRAKDTSMTVCHQKT